MSLVAFILLSSSCKTLKTYPHPDEPIWYSNEIASSLKSPKDKLSVVTFNIEKSENIDLAIHELTTNFQFSDPDILLLQEVDETSVFEFAKKFHLNYIYYPIAIHRKAKNNFGNAILSKYPITKPSKLILPHKTPTKRIRNATNCILEIGSYKLLVYSIHNETIIMSQTKRMEQVDAIIQDIKSRKVEHIIVGGDFNSGIPRDLREIVFKFKSLNFSWPTKEIGGTSKALLNLVSPRNDHFFTKGLTPLSAKKLQESTSSDHIPVLLVFTIEI